MYRQSEKSLTTQKGIPCCFFKPAGKLSNKLYPVGVLGRPHWDHNDRGHTYGDRRQEVRSHNFSATQTPLVARPPIYQVSVSDDRAQMTERVGASINYIGYLADDCMSISSVQPADGTWDLLMSGSLLSREYQQYSISETSRSPDSSAINMADDRRF